MNQQNSEQSNEHQHTPGETAAAVGIAAHTLRRWADYHALHLSAGATSNEPGRARHYTWTDIETLRAVRLLRAQGQTTEQINSHLTAQPVRAVSIVSSMVMQDGPQQAITPVPETDHDTLYNILSARMDSIERSRVDGLTMFAAGVLTAALFFLIIVLLMRPS